MTEKWNAEQFREHFNKNASKEGQARRLKFNNIHTEVDNIRFDSKKEAEYYGTLKLLKRSGKIRDFKRQHAFDLIVNGFHICQYICDFLVVENDGSETVVDVKSQVTEKLPEFRIKRALMKAILNIEIKIV